MSELDWQRTNNGFSTPAGLPDQAFELKRYLGIIRRRAWVILSVFVVLFTLGVLHTFRQPDLYEAEALILVEKTMPQVVKFDEASRGLGVDEEWYNTQVRLAKSKTMLQRACEQPGIKDILAPSQEETEKPRGISGLLGEIKNTLLAALGSKSDPPAGPPKPWEKLAEWFTVERLPATHILRVSSRSADRRKVARVANAVARAFKEYHLQQKRETTSEAFQQLEGLRTKQLKNLDETEEELLAFQENAEMIAAGGEGESNPIIARLDRLSGELIQTELDKVKVESRLNMLKSALGPPGDTGEVSIAQLFALPPVREDDAMMELKDKLLVAEQMLASLAETYGPEHPLRQKAQVRVRQLAESLRSAARTMMGTLANELNLVQNQEELLQEQYTAERKHSLSLSHLRCGLF